MNSATMMRDETRVRNQGQANLIDLLSFANYEINEVRFAPLD